jgi:4'-phosphopantetheinyl transferase
MRDRLLSTHHSYEWFHAYGHRVTTSCAPIRHSISATSSGLLATGTQVWWWHVPTGTYARADLELLDSAEQARLKQLKSAEAAAEYICCRAAVRRILAGFFDLSATKISFGRNPCPGCGSEKHGPPSVVHPETDWHISLSHSSGLGMLAVSPYPVGVDTEAVRDLAVEELTGDVLTRREHDAVLAAPEGPGRTRAFLRCWTRKEAVLKAAGVGIVTDLSRLETRAWSPGPAEVTTDVLAAPTTWQVAETPVPDGWTAAVAVPSGTGGDVTVRQFAFRG